MVEVSTRSSRRRKSPVMGFLIGGLLIAAVALAVYLFWGSRAETPATPLEAAVTDDVNLPTPDTAGVRGQVDAALRATPEGPDQPARQAADAARAQAEGQAPAPAAAPVAPSPSQP